MTVLMDAWVKRITVVKELATDAFKHHWILEESESRRAYYWVCGTGKSPAYSFGVATIPGWLFVTGDIGCLMLNAKHDDMVTWARTSVEDVTYLAKNVPPELPIREYDPELADAWCAGRLDELRRGRPEGWTETCRVVESLSESTNSGELFKQELFASGLVDSCDFPKFDNWTSSFLWCREALLWFLRHYGSKEA